MVRAHAIALVLCATLFGGCAVEGASSEVARLTLDDGASSHVLFEGPTSELLGPASLPLDGLVVDGRPASALVELLDARTATLPGPEGASVLVERDGDALRSGDVAVLVDTPRETVFVRTPEADLVIRLAGVGDVAVRETVLAQIAADFLGADTVSPVAKADFGATALVVLAVSYFACVGGGTALCGQTAEHACGAGEVADFEMICGAGYDVEGAFQLGMKCSFRCQ